MPSATATRPASYLPLIVHGAEEYLTTAQDLQKKENAFLKMAEDLGILVGSDLGYAQVSPIITSNSLVATPVTRGSTPPTTIPELFGATRIEFANYMSPVMFDAIQLEEAGGYEEQINVAESTIYLSAQATCNTLDVDGVRGNVSESIRMLGLEQWIFAEDQATAAASVQLANPRWKFRRATNTVAGITRTAWTSASTGGTGFENLSAEMGVTISGLGTFGFEATSGNQLNVTCKFAQHFYNCCRQGVSFPDVTLSTQKPYEDAANMGMPFVQVMREGAADGAINWGTGGLRFRQSDWYWTDSVAASGLGGGDADAGADMIYFLNSDTWKIQVSNRWFCSLVKPWVYSISPVGCGTQMWTKLQQTFSNPGLNGVMFNYGGA